MSEIYIREELDRIKTSSLLTYIGSSAGPKKKTDIYKWNILLKGPNKTCYEGGLFKLYLEFPQNYPEDPPKIKFVTKIYHPNISLEDGVICISSLSSDWDPSYNIINVIYSIYDMLKNPDLGHGLNEEALSLYQNDYEKFSEKVKETIKENSLFQINNSY
jgi:ubiquitin-protein ligase